MYYQALATLLVLVAIYFITSVATEVFVDDFVKPRSLFAYLLASTLLASSASMVIGVG